MQHEIRHAVHAYMLLLPKPASQLSKKRCSVYLIS